MPVQGYMSDQESVGTIEDLGDGLSLPEPAPEVELPPVKSPMLESPEDVPGIPLNSPQAAVQKQSDNSDPLSDYFRSTRKSTFQRLLGNAQLQLTETIQPGVADRR